MEITEIQKRKKGRLVGFLIFCFVDFEGDRKALEIMSSPLDKLSLMCPRGFQMETCHR